MAVLSAEERRRIFAHVMRGAAGLGNVPNITKDDLRAAVDATDAWIDTNASAFNTALPTAFRTNANLVQKTLLFCYVAMRRAGILRAEEDGS
jgi:hypothetical protein